MYSRLPVIRSSKGNRNLVLDHYFSHNDFRQILAGKYSGRSQKRKSCRSLAKRKDKKILQNGGSITGSLQIFKFLRPVYIAWFNSFSIVLRHFKSTFVQASVICTRNWPPDMRYFERVRLHVILNEEFLNNLWNFLLWNKNDNYRFFMFGILYTGTYCIKADHPLVGRFLQTEYFFSICYLIEQTQSLN